jgi:hypothetical protein
MTAAWEPGDLDPEEIAEFQARLANALEGKFFEYLALLFTPDFVAAYTYFSSWDAMYDAAIAERARTQACGAVDGRRHTAQIPRIQASWGSRRGRTSPPRMLRDRRCDHITTAVAALP